MDGWRSHLSYDTNKSENNSCLGEHWPLLYRVWKLGCARIQFGCPFWLSEKSPRVEIACGVMNLMINYDGYRLCCVWLGLCNQECMNEWAWITFCNQARHLVWQGCNPRPPNGFCLLFFSFFFLGLSAQSRTVMMIISLPHYGNVATKNFGRKKCVRACNKTMTRSVEIRHSYREFLHMIKNLLNTEINKSLTLFVWHIQISYLLHYFHRFTGSDKTKPGPDRDGRDTVWSTEPTQH